MDKIMLDKKVKDAASKGRIPNLGDSQTLGGGQNAKNRVVAFIFPIFLMKARYLAVIYSFWCH